MPWVQSRIYIITNLGILGEWNGNSLILCFSFCHHFDYEQIINYEWTNLIQQIKHLGEILQ